MRSVSAASPNHSLHGIAWITVGFLAFAMLSPVILLEGMSLDGITYATVARNMAQGLGTFWKPAYTSTFLPEFFEHPPLAIGLQSLAFRVVGDQWWLERLYSVLTAIPTAVLVALIWRQVFRETEPLKQFAWLPIALWILMPSWFWIYRHNFLENTLTVFTTAAVYAILRACDSSKRSWLWASLAGLAIFAAVGSKGPVGLFPLATPLVAQFTLRRCTSRRLASVQIILLSALAIALGVVLASPPAREFVTRYFDQQIVNSLQGQREVNDSPLGRFQLAVDLSWDLVLSFALAFLVRWPVRREVTLIGAGETRSATRFFLVSALSASLPIMISPKQSAYYAAASWPLYCLALAAWCAPAAEWLARGASARFALQRSFTFTWRAAAVLAVLITAASPLWWKHPLRDGELMADVDRVAQILGEHHTIAVGPELACEWSLQAYLFRRHYISVAAGDAYQFRLEAAEFPPATAEPTVAAGLSQFRLYRVAGGNSPQPLAAPAWAGAPAKR
ncbi:MAG TPA: glycosyltransferase family 39 protein [Pirellulales bacterium]|jgi:4-amino-4-deoxy-L-arabinose transferase-like glycosyltransferase|nr:glycosyltransferase family 39 protein [Pirellulales bacterium]